MHVNQILFVVAQYALVICGSYLFICGILFNINFLNPTIKKQKYILQIEEKEKKKELEETN